MLYIGMVVRLAVQSASIYIQHIYIFSQFDGRKETLKAEVIFGKSKKMCHRYALKDHYIVENSRFQLLTLIGVIIWYTIKYD